MRNWWLFFAIGASGLLLYTGCTTTAVEQQSSHSLVCPVITQQCAPLTGTIPVIDTTTSLTGDYFVIVPLEGVNTSEHEWAILWWDDTTALVTVERSGKQQLHRYRRFGVHRFQLRDNLLLPFRHYGYAALDVAHRLVYFSAVEPAAVWTDANLYRGHIEMTRVFEPLILPDASSQRSDKHRSRTPTWESQPAIDPKGRALFFASDRGDSVYGTEIWFIVQLADGQWSSPISVGPVVNTSCDELTPFVTFDRQWLLFASTGHGNVGGYDLFRSRIHPEFWRAVDQKDVARLQDTAFLVSVFEPPQNLGRPINTPADELSPYTPLDPDSLLYYASNQAGNTGFDLFVFAKKRQYQIDFVPHRFPLRTRLQAETISTDTLRMPTLTQQDASAVVQGKVIGKEREPLPKAQVRAYTMDTTYAEAQTDTSGQFAITVPRRRRVTIEAEAPGYFPRRIDVIANQDTIKLPDTTLQLPQFTVIRIHFPTDEYANPYPYILDDNGYPTNRTWQEELDDVARSIIRDTAILQEVRIIGHTDDVASEAYNYQLGLRRAKFIYEQLRRRGVPASLMRVESRGEMQKLPRRPEEPLKLYRTRLRRAEIIKVPRQ